MDGGDRLKRFMKCLKDGTSWILLPLIGFDIIMVTPPMVLTVSEMIQSNVCAEQCQVMPTVMEGFRQLHQNTVLYGEWLLGVE